MSKAAWTYRLPTPLPMKPVVFPFKPITPLSKANAKWHASQMENYEHLDGARAVEMKAPEMIMKRRASKMDRIRAENASGRPLWALDNILESYEQEVPATHEMYREVLIGAARWDEAQTAKDCWALMERQKLIPDDKTLCCWFEVCGQLKLRSEALAAWNRYCVEFTFLEEGEEDPKPVVRAKHSLTRDDLYNLPWWKKRWDYDPNVDVSDNHRYNRTRDLYASAAACFTACGEPVLAAHLSNLLADKLLSTPTPAAEPMQDHMATAPARTENLGAKGVEKLQAKPTRFRIPNIYLFNLRRNTRGIDWVPNHEWITSPHKTGLSLPKSSRDSEHGDPRFYSNAQFLLYSAEKQLRAATGVASSHAPHLASKADVLAFLEAIEARLDAFYADADGAEQHAFPRSTLSYHDLIAAALQLCASAAGGVRLAPPDVRALLDELCERFEVRPTPELHQAVFAAFENVEAGSSGDAVVACARDLLATRLELDLQTHACVLKALIGQETGKGFDYFVKHVLRKFEWTNDEVALLLKEARMQGEAGDRVRQKAVAERVSAWCGRYNVGLSEANKQYIEDDFEHIGVEVRTKEELVIFKMRRQAELRNSLTPNLPNPVTDRVTHTLRESDHADPAHLMTWGTSYSNAGRSFKWAFSPHAPNTTPDLHDLTDLNRMRYLPQKNLLSRMVSREGFSTKPFYRPEAQHEKLNINRWLEETNKTFPGN